MIKIDTDMTIAVVLLIAFGLIAFGVYEALTEPEPTLVGAVVQENGPAPAEVSALLREADDIIKQAAKERGHDAVE